MCRKPMLRKNPFDSVIGPNEGISVAQGEEGGKERIGEVRANTIIESGHARCVTEPSGSHGLEGFVLGQFYQFERCEDEKGRYCRVYPDRSLPGYYETGGEGVFAGCFEPVVSRERRMTVEEILK